MARASPVAVYARGAAVAIRASVADRSSFILQSLSMVVNNGFILLLWFMFFAGFRSVGGWRLADMALLIGLMMTIVGVAGVAFGGYRDMAATILSGEIDALLTQPRSVLARLVSRDSYPSAWGDLAVGVVILAVFAKLGWRDLPWLSIGLTGGLVVYIAAAVIFASLAFWIAGARSLARDLTEFVILVSSYPGAIYGGASKVIAYTLLPAGFVVLAPVSLVRHPNGGTLLVVAGSALGYAAIASAIFHLGLRRYRRGSTPVMGG
jgi:ABC-2 type transport system permease protein